MFLFPNQSSFAAIRIEEEEVWVPKSAMKHEEGSAACTMSGNKMRRMSPGERVLHRGEESIISHCTPAQ